MEKLLGYKHLDFIAEDGSIVKGDILYTSFSEDGVVGEKCDKLFIRDGSMELPPLTPGMMLEIIFARKSRVTAVKAVTAPAAKS